MIACLIVTLSDKRIAKVIGEALSPDNIDLPQGMQIDQKILGRNLNVRVSISKVSTIPIETLISTLDEFLSHIQTATHTLETTELGLKIDRSKDNKRRPTKNQRQSSKAKHD